MADHTDVRGGDRRRGPEPGSFAWWIQSTLGVALSLLLMAMLAGALTMLTRMVVEGTTDVALHPTTFIVWFVVCIVLIVVPMIRATWRQLVGRPPEETPDQPGARAPSPAAGEGWVTSPLETPDPMAVAAGSPAGPRPEGPAPGDGLRSAGLICLAAWIPVMILALVVLEFLPREIGREWGLTTFVLLPMGWVLWLVGLVVRHRALRSPWSRSDLAGFLAMTGFVVVVIGAVVVLTAIIMRLLGVGLIATSVTIAAGWLVRSQMPHVLDSEDPEDAAADVGSVSD